MCSHHVSEPAIGFGVWQMNGVLKILSKVLCIRLSKLYGNLISDDQAAFRKRRQINDSFLTVAEIISHSRRMKASGVLLKLDFEKAFDMVSWPFLLAILKARGFSDRWCKWAECTITTNKVALPLNGNLTRRIKTRQGLKQGDPLSLFFFILVTDVLNQILRLAVRNGLVTGIGSPSITGNITCLQYANDTIILSDANYQHIQHLKFMLYTFEILSGLKINFDKSALYAIELLQDPIKHYTMMLGCKPATMPTSYLGFPLSTTPLKASDWSFLTEKIDKKLSAWKDKLLSLGGRLALVNLVLSALPTYWMSTYLLPTSVINTIDKWRRKFLWRGDKQCKRGHCLASWDTICKLKRYGGLGILNLSLHNKCLLKRWWRYANEPLETWRMLIYNEHYRDRIDQNEPIPRSVQASQVWKSVAKVRPLFNAYIKSIIGDGKRTLLWSDRW